MSMPLSWNNAVFNDIHSTTTTTKEDYAQVWVDTRNKLINLIMEDHVDARLGEVIAEREQEFKALCDEYDVKVSSVDSAMHKTQTIGMDGGAAMRNIMQMR